MAGAGAAQPRRAGGLGYTNPDTYSIGHADPGDADNAYGDGNRNHDRDTHPYCDTDPPATSNAPDHLERSPPRSGASRLGW